MFENIDEIKAHINVSKQLDFNMLKPYIEIALNDKIFPMVGNEIVTMLETDSRVLEQKESIYFLIKRATANYAVALSIPFLKMHLSNTGANTFSDGKTERSPWWDIRDYGLNAISVGDKALNDAIYHLQESDWKEKLPILSKIQNTLFASPFEFSSIYPIGDSYEVFLKLIPIMEDVWHLYLSEQLSSCTRLYSLLYSLRIKWIIFNIKKELFWSTKSSFSNSYNFVAKTGVEPVTSGL